MKIWNRIVWFFLLVFVILLFYLTYNYFFKIKLQNLEINSNINYFSWTLKNSKYKKDFFCKEKFCILSWLPEFKYKIEIYKKWYKKFVDKIDLSQNNKINVFLEKKVILKEVKTIQPKNNKGKYKSILGNVFLKYYQKNDNLYFLNIRNNSSFYIQFVPKINYIKNIWNNNYIIVTKIWSFDFDYKSKKLEYFSLFDDYVIKWHYYIWVIWKNDLDRKNNFWLKNNFADILLLYDRQTKKFIVIADNLNIKRIYNKNSEIFIDTIWNKRYKIEL